MSVLKNRISAVVAGSAVLVAVGATSAVAGNLIGSADIRDGGVHRVDLGDAVNARIANKATDGQVNGLKGRVTELEGASDSDQLGKAYYSVAYYDAGDTNAGAIATVACSDLDDVAISGGVQVLGLGDGANSRNTPVSSSFPGRMDWSTNTPRTDRLDGWIVQFGGNAGATSDKAPEKTKVWALCVPGADVPVVQTYQQTG
jgi:hypothetical protein